MKIPKYFFSSCLLVLLFSGEPCRSAYSSPLILQKHTDFNTKSARAGQKMRANVNVYYDRQQTDFQTIHVAFWNVDTHQSYLYDIDANAYGQALLCIIPEGIYDVQCYDDFNIYARMYTVGCGNYAFAIAPYFSGVTIDNTCNTILIQ